MEIYEFSYMPQGTAICLGDFDGAHKGHRQVFSKAAETGKWGALLFTHNSKGEKEILTLPEKLEVLKQLGAGYAVAADFETELKEKSPGEFIVFLKELAVNKVVTGYDYRFGKGAAGDVTLLKALCGKYGIEADARREADGWCLPDFDDSKWQNVCRAETPRGEFRLCTGYVLRKTAGPGGIAEGSSWEKTGGDSGGTCTFRRSGQYGGSGHKCERSEEGHLPCTAGYSRDHRYLGSGIQALRAGCGRYCRRNPVRAGGIRNGKVRAFRGSEHPGYESAAFQ